jgi:Mg-chelatase subunit ChlD
LELSSNYYAITNTLWTAFSASDYTNIGDGIYRGCEILSTNEAEGHHGRTNAVHVMILLSDGKPNRPCNPATMNCTADQPNTWSLQHIDNAVDWAVQNGIIIFTISLGAGAQQDLMTDIAETTGGIHQYAETTDDLYAVFQEIAQHIYLRLTG